MDEHKKYLKDPGFSLDKNGKPKIRKFGRDVTFFSGGSYCLQINQTIYYYDSKGKLEGLSYSLGNTYPKLSVKYDINGILIAVIFNINKNEAYMYEGNKKYLGRWIGEKFYAPSGQVTSTRTN